MIGKWEEEGKEIIIGGDFNIRIGELGCMETEEIEIGRRSKDKVIGNEGRNLVEWIQEKGLYVLNGVMEGDWEGEFTYVGARGSTVIDYVMTNEKAYDKVREFRIDNRVDSDHMPMIVVREEEEGRQDKEEAEIILWNEAIKKYNERAEELSRLGGQVGETIEQKWEELKRIVEGAMIRKRYKRRRKKIGYKDWWDR